MNPTDTHLPSSIQRSTDTRKDEPEVPDDSSLDLTEGWGEWTEEPAELEDDWDPSLISRVNLQQIVASLATPNKSESTTPTGARTQDRGAVHDLPASEKQTMRQGIQTLGIPQSILPPRMGDIENHELAEAFLQDAARGVASMEQAVINYESQVQPDEAIQQICRELHTLKGASGIAGLDDVSRYLHEVEDFLQGTQHAPSTITEVVLSCIEALREQAARTSGSYSKGKWEASPITTDTRSSETSGETEDSISVKASQLDRLMDMLAALVMLRNQRESRVDQLRSLNSELSRCNSKLREVESLLSTVVSAQEHSDPVGEVASDLSEISRALRELYEPVADENLAVSNFIRQFRQALVKLLRMPLSGMFRRLQRAALDAARVENKRVRLVVDGSNTGLERSIQERLFEPLLHIVRNCVSHGIELPQDRQRLGKDPVGTITLEATGAPSLLVLTVRDDGRGLDYEALRRRGIEMGLLHGDRHASPQELAQLIFRPGFSTRETANEIAGRGVGMDVVVHTLDRMHSWVEVDSVPGKGTSVRLTIPLRSIIEHAMVFRCGSQLFALPMQHVKQAGKMQPSEAEFRSLSQILQVESSATDEETSYLSIESQPLLAESKSLSPNQTDSRISFVVDSIIGPEEVVIRPLPPLFRQQGLFAGVTLSGNGQIVLVLDPRKLIDLVSKGAPHVKAIATPRLSQGRVLIVDDSLSARRGASLMLRRHGFETIEATDGNTALEILEHETFSAIITDYDMPQMNGIELVEQIRRDQGPKLPVIMLSSRCEDEMRAIAIEHGVTCYLKKPMTEASLETLVAPLILNFVSGELRNEN